MEDSSSLRILQDSLLGAPIIWKGDYPYFIHPISDGIPRMEAKVLRATRDLIVSIVDWNEIDLIVSVEAMGLPLLAAVGDATGKPTVVIRKRSYGMEGEVSVNVSTGYSESTVYINDIKKGEKILAGPFGSYCIIFPLRLLLFPVVVPPNMLINSVNSCKSLFFL